MKKIKLGSGFLIFLLFFGIASLNAIQSQNWARAFFWAAIGVAFLVADNPKKA